MEDMISTPLIFPKIEPSNWIEWWRVWFKNSKFLSKTSSNHNGNPGSWVGLSIYAAPGIDADIFTGYIAPYVDCSHLFKELIDNIDQLPIDVKVIRALSSTFEFPPHTDFSKPKFSVRSLLYDTNPNPTFYYQIKNKKVYQHLPPDSNTWGYWDNKCNHGSDYHNGYRKILLIFYGNNKENLDTSSSVDKYSDYVIREN